MPTGPNGEKRPADSVGCAVTVMRIASGEEQDTVTEDTEKRSTKRPDPGRSKGGKAGGPARAQKLTAEQRSEIAQTAAAARWSK